MNRRSVQETTVGRPRRLDGCLQHVRRLSNAPECRGCAARWNCTCSSIANKPPSWKGPDSPNANTPRWLHQEQVVHVVNVLNPGLEEPWHTHCDSVLLSVSEQKFRAQVASREQQHVILARQTGICSGCNYRLSQLFSCASTLAFHVVWAACNLLKPCLAHPGAAVAVCACIVNRTTSVVSSQDGGPTVSWSSSWLHVYYHAQYADQPR